MRPPKKEKANQTYIIKSDQNQNVQEGGNAGEEVTERRK